MSTPGKVKFFNDTKGSGSSSGEYDNRTLQARRHADSSATLRELSDKLDQHAAAVATIQPTVAALELSRSKLATWASIGLGAVALLGWVVEAGIKWALSVVLSHFQ